MARSDQDYVRYPPDAEEQEPFITHDGVNQERGEEQGTTQRHYPKTFWTRKRLRITALAVISAVALGTLGALSSHGIQSRNSKISESSQQTSSGNKHPIEELASEEQEQIPDQQSQGSHQDSEDERWSWDKIWKGITHQQDTSEEQQDDEELGNYYGASDLFSNAATEDTAATTGIESHWSIPSDSSTSGSSQNASIATLITRPEIPDIVPRPPASEERYLSYNPHSGFHNQRIALTNAILLANMLNRTLLVPPVRLGKAIGWKDKATLQGLLENDRKDTARVQTCLGGNDVWENPAEEVESQCRTYSEYTEVGWAFLVDLNRTGTRVPLIERKDYRREWFSSPDGLNISEDSIMSINDTVQYDYKIYTTQEGLDAVNEPGRDGLDNYNFAMPLHTLLTPEAESKRLIEFGSLYGSFRINLKGADPRWSKLLLKIQGAMMFKTDLLNSISRQMASLMGGNENFIGLHLRVGDGAFKDKAEERMHLVLLQALKSLFRYKESEAREFEEWAIAQKTKTLGETIAKRQDQSLGTWAWHEDEAEREPCAEENDELLIDGIEDVHVSRSQTSIQTEILHRRRAEEILTCQRPLHADPKMSHLNAHVYIATDARNPREESFLSSYFTLFPCAHILADFEEHVPALTHLKNVYSEEERLPMFKFLVPFLEGETAARGVRVLGTTGSTFSRFVVTVLHSNYWPVQGVQQKALEALWRRLKLGS